MPFDPTKPANGTPTNSLEMREQLTSLKTLIDVQAALNATQGTQITTLSAQLLSQGTQIAALMAQVDALAFAVVPIGGVVPWHKDTPGTPALPANFVECNGQTLSDAESPLDGQVIADYNNAARFPRAGTTSDTTGGNATFGFGTAETFVGGTPLGVVSPDFSPGASPFPPFITSVFVMRVK